MISTLSKVFGLNTYLLDSSSHDAHMQCLANNIDKCHWGNKNAAGYQDGGWTAVYLKCKLYELREVRPLSGSE